MNEESSNYLRRLVATEKAAAGRPSLPFLLLQIELLPEGALDFGVHFPWFSLLHHLCVCHKSGDLQNKCVVSYGDWPAREADVRRAWG